MNRFTSYCPLYCVVFLLACVLVNVSENSSANSTANSIENVSKNATTNATAQAPKNITANSSKSSSKNVTKNSFENSTKNASKNVTMNNVANSSGNSTENASKMVKENSSTNSTANSTESASKMAKENSSTNSTANSTESASKMAKENSSTNSTGNASKNATMNDAANSTDNASENAPMNATTNHKRESPGQAMSRLVASLTNEKVYNKNIRPYFGEKPVKVTVWILVNDIYSVSENSMDFTIDFHFRQYWNDPRLAFTPINNMTDELNLGEEFAKLIWLPDTYTQNSKSLDTHLSNSKQTSTMVRVKQGGDIIYSTRLTTKATCPMDLKYFPGDKQNCKLVLASYNPTNELILKWAPGSNSSSINSVIFLPTFTLTSYNTTKTEVTFSSRSGTYARLILEMRFERSLGYYINQIYVPAFLIVVISWMPFWLDRNDNHARVGLGVTTVLTITTLVTSTNESMPKVSYIKYIDIYLFVCFLMVFLSLIEFATIGFFESEQPEQKEEPVKFADNKNDNKIKPLKKNTAWIDRVSRFLFPTVFISFNLIYIGVFVFIIGKQ